MKIATGVFTGNGDVQKVSCGFEPDAVITRTDSASDASGLWLKGMFAGRSNSLSAVMGYPQGVLPCMTGFHVGSDSKVNRQGAQVYWIAFANNADDSMEIQDWIGNGSSRDIKYQTAKTPKGVIIKRDNARSAIFKSATSNKSTFLDGSGTGSGSTTAYVSALATGQITLDGANETNEYFGSLGEGISGVAFFGSSNSDVISWTGDGVAGRVIALPFSAKAVVVVREGAASAARIKTAEMTSTTAGTSTAAGLQANDFSLAGSTLTMGPSGWGNVNAQLYSAIVFGNTDPIYQSAPAIITSSKKAIRLPGRSVSSYIDCGVSDATLKITGAITLEWMGALKYAPGGNGAVGIDAPMIFRSGGPEEASGTPGLITTAGNVSFGAAVVHHNDTTAGYCAQFMPVCQDYFDIRSNLMDVMTSAWRTGIVPPSAAKPFHYMLTYDGGQFWKMYINGELIKQRQYSMVSKTLNNIVGGTGHKTVIGARWNGSAFVSPSRQDFMLSRVYSRALSIGECVARFERSALGSQVADVTTNLAEEWDAANARGTVLPATVNAANNGTIVGGSLLSL